VDVQTGKLEDATQLATGGGVPALPQNNRWRHIMSSRSSRKTGSRAKSDLKKSRGRNGFVDSNEDTKTTCSSRSQGSGESHSPSKSDSYGKKRDRKGARRRMFEKKNKAPDVKWVAPSDVGDISESEGFGGPSQTPTPIPVEANDNDDDNDDLTSDSDANEADESLTKEVYIFYRLPTVRYFNFEGLSACLNLFFIVLLHQYISLLYFVALFIFGICILMVVYLRCEDVNIIYPMSKLSLEIDRRMESLGGFTFYINFFLEGRPIPSIMHNGEYLDRPSECINLLEKAGYNTFRKGLVYHQIVRKMVTKMYTKTVNLNTYEMIYSEVMSMYQEEYEFDKDIDRLTVLSNTCTVVLNCMALHSILRKLAYPKDVKSLIQSK